MCHLKSLSDIKTALTDIHGTQYLHVLVLDEHSNSMSTPCGVCWQTDSWSLPAAGSQCQTAHLVSLTTTEMAAAMKQLLGHLFYIFELNKHFWLIIP